ncbi:hypothetical protein ACV22V_31005 [Burkholderia sp. AW33-5]
MGGLDSQAAWARAVAGTPPRLHTRDADTDEWVAGNKTIGAIAPILYDD